MKKKVLLSVLAAGLVLPTASALALDNPAYKAPDNKVTATVAERGPEYALALADFISARTAAETTGQILFSAKENRDAVYRTEDAKVAAATKALEDVKTEWANASKEAVRNLAAEGKTADSPEAQAAILVVDTAYGPRVDAAEKTLKEVTDKATKAKEKADKEVADAQADFDKAQKALAEAYARLEALGVSKAEADAAAAKAPAAKAGAAKKALPKTSAVK